MKNLTQENLCPECGNNTFTLCRDSTHYSCVEVEDGKLVVTYDHEEFDEVRLLCVECGKYLNVPEELES